MCPYYIVGVGWRNDIPELLRISNIYVASSKSEGLGLNLIEAMACELPVVASRNRGHVEIIRHGHDGYIVEQNDAKKMAEYVVNIYENNELCQLIVDHARDSIVKFEIDSVIKEEERILRKYT